MDYFIDDSDVDSYALKQSPIDKLDEKESTMISEEIETLCSLSHPNIVKLIGILNDSKGKDRNGKEIGIGIVMELCENGSLRGYLDKQYSTMKMDEVLRIVRDIAEGMRYLHRHVPDPIIHRDLKSDNVLFDGEMNVKICDFGLSRIVETSKIQSIHAAGTFNYMAPEAFNGEYGFFTDVYAFGCVIYEILSGKQPWYKLQRSEIMTNVLVKKKQPDMTIIRKDAPFPLASMMKQCLEYEKEKRPTFTQIKAAFG